MILLPSTRPITNKDDRLVVQSYLLKTQWTFYQVFLRGHMRNKNRYISKFHKASGHHIWKIGTKNLQHLVHRIYKTIRTMYCFISLQQLLDVCISQNAHIKKLVSLGALINFNSCHELCVEWSQICKAS